jgi:N-acetylglucosaminyldiphosphoundecaprenol N-acetyl-beta-D-mannosaminyltransferase
MRWSPASGACDPITVNVPSQAALLCDIEARMDAGQGTAVATLNLDHVVKLSRDRAFQAAYGRHSHVTADGRPVVWLTRLAGQRVDLVTGSDLVMPLMALAARMQWPVGLVGATAPVLETAATRLQAAEPGLQIVTRIAPAMGFDPHGAEAAALLDQVQASGARVILLALGAPKQEIFAARCIERLPGVCVVSIGAGLDFIAGTQRRAPRWVRKLAAEWLWRLGTAPKRLAGRYAACAVLLPKLTLQAMLARIRARGHATDG